MPTKVSELEFSRDEVLAELKREQGVMTQKDFAGLLGISPQYLNDVYQGNRQTIPEAALARIGFEEKVGKFRRVKR